MLEEGPCNGVASETASEERRLGENVGGDGDNSACVKRDEGGGGGLLVVVCCSCTLDSSSSSLSVCS